jgi:DNA polymerase-3 subunit epsilon
MREIVLDTETTGFEPHEGDRIVEIGAIELMGHVPTGRTYHQYINPQRSMPIEAFGVHGIGPDLLEPPQEPKPGQETLRDKPLFKDIAQDFVDFIGDAKLVIHNAAFDMKFLNAELGWLNRPLLPMDQAVDTLAIARRKFPGSPASLDALCRRFAIDNSSRTLHGALLDSEILAEVYLELIGGRQPDFALAADTRSRNAGGGTDDWRPMPRQEPLAPRITKEEAAAHAAFIEKLGDGAIWKN